MAPLKGNVEHTPLKLQLLRHLLRCSTVPWVRSSSSNTVLRSSKAGPGRL
jgi:hypothetical protein